jgi:Fic family protein
MNTLRLFARKDASVPASTSWYLADLGEFRGQQELYTRQSPQRLKALREHAMIESAVSSNRIEGVALDPSRVRDVLVAPKPLFRDRDEEEVRGYRDALKLIHDSVAPLPVSVASILKLHRLARGEIWDAGQYKEKDSDIIERYPDGGERVRFRAVSALDTPAPVANLITDWQHCLDERWIHPLVALSAFNLDFLCIHPFRDGNGRVSRLVLLLQCYQLGYEVGHYVSLERLIEQNKTRYYETLEQSSQGWHQGRHDPWPYINYVLSILKMAYRDFAERVGDVKAPRGAKTEQILTAINAFSGVFTVTQLEQACPGVSRDMIRRVLRAQQNVGAVECQGRGPAARWEKKG